MQRRVEILGLFFFFLSAFGCAANAQGRGDAVPAELSPCPDSPNCVSTESRDPGHAMPPLPYVGTRQESHKRLLRVLRGMKRSSLLVVTPTYLRAEFRSALFRFVDGVEFLFDDQGGRIHFRSASRTGYYDFGVNRRRMQEISRMYGEE
ncbi:MAG: DUF1499 domain-containing protein [Deltaproteobacteria bacterium]|nr:DUF1499 domain-containing protein [Deltaproteobacteria bacterium]